MNYKQTHFCITCGSQILDDQIAKECAVCRVEATSAEFPQRSTIKLRTKKSLSTWVTSWFIIGLIWYLFDMAEMSTDYDGWLLYIEALRPDSYGEFVIKTLGVLVAGLLVVRRMIPSITSFIASLIKGLAITAVIFVGIAIVFNPSVQSKLNTVGSELLEWIKDVSSENDVRAAPEDVALIANVQPTVDTEAIEPIRSKDLSSVVQLRQHVLELINTDRTKHGVEPVVLGRNTAAQDHANDMLAFGYLGHWWVDGKKPYMAYSQAGGTSYVAENAAVAGHKIAGYIDNDCSSFFSLCEELDPTEQLERLQYAMVYDDAESNWGHRDTMLDSTHTEVSIGIAFADDFISLVQHFSGNGARAVEGPVFSGTRLRLKIELVDPSTKVFEAIAVWWEPLPSPRDPEDIGALRAYCVGGDFTAECGDPVFSIFPPAPSGQYYEGLDLNEVVAEEWLVEPGMFEFEAELPWTRMKPGMYTVGVLKDTGSEQSDQVLIMLSTRWTE